MIAVIPSIGESEYLPGLLATLAAEDCVTEVIVVDNSPMETSRYRAAERALEPGEHFATVYDAITEGHIRVLRIPGQTIYATWNMGMNLADARGTHCAILNDDLILPSGSLEVCRATLDRLHFTFDPAVLCGLNYGARSMTPDLDAGTRQVEGTFRTGGFGGFAFVVHGGLCPRVDERFRWWYGDDDLAERIKAAGLRMVVANGAPVQHPKPSTSGNAHPWTAAAAAEDAVLFRELWPDAP